MVDGRDVGVELAEAERAMADHLDLVVHPFQCAVGNADLGPGQDSIEMIADHPCKLLEGLEPGVAGPPKPLPEVRLGSTGLVILPELAERLLEQIRLRDREIEFQDLPESLPFSRFEIPRVLDENPSAFLDREPFLGSQRGHDLPTDVVHRPCEVLDDVEAVEDHCGLGNVTPDTGQVRRPHVHADDLNRPGSPFAQPGEESVYGLLLSVLPHPNHLMPVQIVRDSQIPVPLLAAHLVQAQDVQGTPFLVSESPLDGPLYCPCHVAPLEMQVFRYLLVAHLAGKGGGGPGQAMGGLHFFSPPRELSPARSRIADSPDETGRTPRSAYDPEAADRAIASPDGALGWPARVESTPNTSRPAGRSARCAPAVPCPSRQPG